MKYRIRCKNGNVCGAVTMYAEAWRIKWQSDAKYDCGPHLVEAVDQAKVDDVNEAYYWRGYQEGQRVLANEILSTLHGFGGGIHEPHSVREEASRQEGH